MLPPSSKLKWSFCRSRFHHLFRHVSKLSLTTRFLLCTWQSRSSRKPSCNVFFLKRVWMTLLTLLTIGHFLKTLSCPNSLNRVFCPSEEKNLNICRSSFCEASCQMQRFPIFVPSCFLYYDWAVSSVHWIYAHHLLRKCGNSRSIRWPMMCPLSVQLFQEMVLASFFILLSYSLWSKALFFEVPNSLSKGRTTCRTTERVWDKTTCTRVYRCW